MMRLVVTFVLAALLLAVTTGQTRAQCQGGGQRQRGGQRGPMPQTGNFPQTASFLQAGFSPLLARQTAAQQQIQFAILQQQAALQQLRWHQQLAQSRADQERVSRRRAGAAERRAAVLAKRERARNDNLARLANERSPKDRRDDTTELVSLRKG